MKFGDFFSKQPENIGESKKEGKSSFRKIVNAVEIAAFVGLLSAGIHESGMAQNKSEKPLKKPEIVKLQEKSLNLEKNIIESLDKRVKNKRTLRIFISDMSGAESEDVPIKDWTSKNREVEVLVGFDKSGAKPRFMLASIDGGRGAIVDNDMNGSPDRVIINKSDESPLHRNAENVSLAFGSMERLQELAELTPDEMSKDVSVYELERRPDGTIGVKGVNFIKKEFMDVNSSQPELKEKIEKLDSTSHGDMVEALQKIGGYIEGEAHSPNLR